MIENRIPILVENIYNHLSNDGYGIFEINTGTYQEIHQTVKPLEWWIEQFQNKFVICKDLTNMDFKYIRSYRINGKLFYQGTNNYDGFKQLFWVKKNEKCI